MLLYSKHNVEYDLLKSIPELSKSTLYSDKYDGFKRAYDFLYTLIPNIPYIWCYPSLSDFSLIHTSQHNLYVFDYDIYKNPCYIINGYVWDFIIHDINDYPDYIYDCCDDNVAEELARDYDLENPKQDFWKKNLFLKSLEPNKDCQVLIPYSEAIKNLSYSSILSDYSLDTILSPDNIYRIGFEDFQSADIFLSVIKSIYDKYNWDYTCSLTNPSAHDNLYTAFIEKL